MCVISTTAMRHARTLLVVLVSLALGLAGLGSAPAAHAAGWSLRGTVVAPGDGVLTGTVSAWSHSSYSAVESEVGPDGAFELTGLANGQTYWILFASTNAATAVSGWYAADDKSLLPRETAILDGVRVSAGAQITLRPVAPRLVEGTLSAPAAWTGSPDEVTLALLATTTTGRTARSTVRVAVDGSFQLPLAPHLTYRLRLASGSGLVPGYWTHDGSIARSFAEGTAIDETVTRVIVAPVLPSTLSGRVELPPGYGSTTAGLSVVAQTWDGEYWDDEQWTIGGTASVAADGSFSLPELPTGQAVRLRFTDSLDRLIDGLVSASDGSTGSTGDDALILVDGTKVVIRPLMAVSVRGTVEVPASYDWEQSFPPYVQLLDADTDDEVDSTSLDDGSTTFAFGGHSPDREFVLRLNDGSNQLVEGYLADPTTGTLTRSRDQAARIRGGGAALTLRPAANLAISGRVVLPAGQEGAGGRVTLRDSRSGSWAGDRWVGADGSFRFVGLAAGRSFVLEYEPSWQSVLGGYYSSTQRYLATSIEQATPVTSGQSGVTLRPRVAATMSGRVVKPSGFTGSLENSAVYAYPEGHEDAPEWMSASLAADGTFRIAGLDPSRFYALKLERSGLVTGYLGGDGAWETSPTRAALLAPQSGVTLRPTLAPRITGRIELPAGVSWSDVNLDVQFEDGPYVSPSTDGTFVVRDLQPDETFRLILEDRSGAVAGGWYASATSPLTRDRTLSTRVRAGSTDIVLRPQRTAVVRGEIELPEDVDPASVDVDLVASPGPDGPGRDSVARVTADGTFSLEGLDPNLRYSLRVEEPSGTLATGPVFASGGPVRQPTEDEWMTPAELPRSIRLSRAGTIEARVSLPSTPGVTYGAPRVTAYDLSGRVVSRSTARASGIAVLTNVPQDGTFVVKVEGSGIGTAWYAGEDAPLVAGRSSATPVPGSSTITLATVDAATVTGRVAPSTDEWLTVVAVDTASGEIVSSDHAGPGETFALSGLLPGKYVVGADLDDEWSSYAPTYYAAGSTGTVRRSAATTLTLAPGAAAGDVALDAGRCATWSGVVDQLVGAEDVATVRLWDDGLVVRAWEGDEGEDEFVIRGVGPGTYHVGLSVGSGPERRLDDVSFATCDDVSGARLGDDPAVRPTTTPALTGSLRVGATLTVSPGTWAPTPSTVTYEWLRGTTPIAGATASSYRLTTADLGHPVRARVTAQLTGLRPGVREVGARWEPVERGSLGTGIVTLAGKAALGSSLTASVTDWPTTDAVTWRWERDGAPITGATSARYTVTQADVGHALTAVASANRYGYEPAVATSTPRTALFAFVALSPPRITGTVAVGSTVTASRGTWSRTPTTVRYTWLRNGAAITGASSSTYVPVAADVGKLLSVRVTATLTGYPSASATSATSKVAPGTIRSVTKPRITGTPRVGATLRVSSGTWSVTGVSLRYQWLRNGSAISGATGATYVARSADLRTRLSVRVTASKPGYRPTTVTATTATVTQPAAAFF